MADDVDNKPSYSGSVFFWSVAVIPSSNWGRNVVCRDEESSKKNEEPAVFIVISRVAGNVNIARTNNMNICWSYLSARFEECIRDC